MWITISSLMFFLHTHKHNDTRNVYTWKNDTFQKNVDALQSCRVLMQQHIRMIMILYTLTHH